MMRLVTITVNQNLKQGQSSDRPFYLSDLSRLGVEQALDQARRLEGSSLARGRARCHLMAL